MFSSAFLITALSSLAIAAASPTLTARSCTPIFEGNPISITNWFKPGEWAPSSLRVNAPVNAGDISLESGEWRVEQDGNFPAGYIIKATGVPANDLAVSSDGPSDTLILDRILNGKPTDSQTFYISCDLCGALDNYAAGQSCTIRTADDRCVTFDSAGGSSDLRVEGCSEEFDEAQNFDFIREVEEGTVTTQSVPETTSVA